MGIATEGKAGKRINRFKTLINKTYKVSIHGHVRFFSFLVRQLGKHVEIRSWRKPSYGGSYAGEIYEIICFAKTLRNISTAKRILRDYIGGKGSKYKVYEKVGRQWILKT